MTRDDDFEPKLGKIGNKLAPKERSYLQRVLKGVALAGSRRSGGSRKKRFDGSRIGRGSGAGRVLASRDRHAAFRARRVIVKSRIVKLKGRGLKAARLHLRYIQRDGVARDGEAGVLYDASHARTDGNAFLDRAEGDRHQFRFIVSPEDGDQYADLRSVTRRLMAQMEDDLGTKLDWVAVDHFNTGHPHTHVVLRGVNDLGKDLIIAREYMSHGMRERAAEIVLRDLGIRSDLEIEQMLRREVDQDRFTSLDRQLINKAGEEHTVAIGAFAGDDFRQSLAAGRLQKLGRMGLAEELQPGRWHLAENLEPTLRAMGERGDIIKTLHHEMSERKLHRAAPDYAIYDPQTAPPFVGRIIARGLSDELHDQHYLIVDGVNGCASYVDIGRAGALEDLPIDSVVAIRPRQPTVREADRIVANIAAAHGGRYSVAIHLQHDRTATADFAETHVRRLEAMRRAGMNVTRANDGTWTIAPDHLETAAAFERKQIALNPVAVETLSTLSIERQVMANGATWLDRQLVSREPTPLREAGFGQLVSDALTRRRQWLVEQGLVQEREAGISYRPGLLTQLQRRELSNVAAQLSTELHLDYAEPGSDGRITGIYRRTLDLASGRFALIEGRGSFTLVPWRPVLDRHVGKQVLGTVRGHSISWNFGRSRGGPGPS